MTDETIILDSYEPDYTCECDCCGSTPCVTGVKDGKVVLQTDMCGVCTWGEAAMLNPTEWNI